MADTTKTNTQAIIDFNLFDGVEVRGNGPEAQYPMLGKPSGTAKTYEGQSHSTLDVSMFEV